MEITLEKIELVKDRTGVSYREAKEALEATEGNVVDAIIKIEDEINVKVGTKITDSGAKVVKKIKEYVKKGNVSKISVRKDGEIMMNIPVTVGVVGTVLAPWLTVIGSIVALGVKCDILIVKEDGTTIDLTGKVNNTFNDIREKGTETADSVKTKAAAAAGTVKGKATAAAGTVKTKATAAADAVKEKKDKAVSDIEDIKDIVTDAAKGAATDIKKTIKKEDKKSPEAE